MGPMHGRFLGFAFAFALAVAGALTGCGKSDETCKDGACTCASGETDCSGTCIDMQVDPSHCGGCGMACAAGEACIDGGCQVPCDASKLMASIRDPWGITWDGLERTASTLDAASVDCAAFGGRLPTATEMYRVSASRSGAVGQSFQTNYLWSRTANDRVSQVTTRLSDGATSASTAATSTIPYRCVCQAAPPRTFSGARCNGPQAGGCFRWGPYNLDAEDRPALRKSAAVQECVGEHAHLADLPLLGAAIRAGLPGSNSFITVADGSRYDMTTTIRWGGAAPWEVSGNVSAVTLQTPAPFRCAGTAAPASISATPVANEFRPTLSPYKSEAADHPAAAWAAAHDTCWKTGGHLPRSTELAELIGQGLPGGSGANLWTSDQLGYNGTQFLAAVMRWTGLDRRFPFEYTGGPDLTATWAYKTDAGYPFRCIYYPIDPMFQPPATCNGGCNVRSAGGPAVTIVFDMADRPTATVAAAIADCAATGGYLASERDLTEAIRDGLPNGTNAYLNTWDVGQGNVTIVNWAGVNQTFNDQYSAFMTWSDPVTPRPYRCMWTNELR